MVEEKDSNEAGDKEGRWRCACVYNCGKSPEEGEESRFPELVNVKEMSWRM